MNNQKIVLTAMDFLIMAQNGTLRVLFKENGEISGLSVADELIEEYDGMLVALNDFSQSVSKIEYTLIRRAPKTPPVEMIMEEEIQEELDA